MGARWFRKRIESKFVRGWEVDFLGKSYIPLVIFDLDKYHTFHRMGRFLYETIEYLLENPPTAPERCEISGNYSESFSFSDVTV